MKPKGAQDVMAILRWDAVSKTVVVRDRFAKLFEYALSQMNVDIRSPASWSPPADIFEVGDCYIMKIEVPGMPMEDLVIEVSGGSVTVVGRRRRIREVTEEHYQRVERSYGRFIRHFIFPLPVHDAEVSARLTDGLLTITLPKERLDSKDSFVRVDIE
jgi:HSP20 family protein